LKYQHYGDGRNDLKISNLEEIFTTRENPENKAIYKNYLQLFTTRENMYNIGS